MENKTINNTPDYDDIDTLFNEYIAGATLTSIAKRYNTTHQRVRGWFDKKGLYDFNYTSETRVCFRCDKVMTKIRRIKTLNTSSVCLNKDCISRTNLGSIKGWVVEEMIK